MHEIFEHTADFGLRIRASDLPSLFAEAAIGLFSAIVANFEIIRPIEEVQFVVPGTDHEELLHDWLSELLFTFHIRRMVFSEFQVQLTPDGMNATGCGEPIDLKRHEIDVEIKAITWHGLKITPLPNEFQAEVIVDI